MLSMQDILKGFATLRAKGALGTEPKRCVETKRKELRTKSLSPLQSLPTTMLTLWMCGNNIHLFNITFIVMALVQPVRMLASTGKCFMSYPEVELREDVKRAQVIYILLSLVALGVGILKCVRLGLIPLTHYE